VVALEEEEQEDIYSCNISSLLCLVQIQTDYCLAEMKFMKQLAGTPL
jgi:hypothetical protein